MKKSSETEHMQKYRPDIKYRRVHSAALKTFQIRIINE